MPTFNYPFNQISEEQKATLRNLCLATDGKRILEIGSWVGESTSVLAQCAKENNGLVYCVDWFKGNPGTEIGEFAKDKDIFPVFKSNLQEIGLYEYIEPYIMKSEEAESKFGDNYFDFIFIDADHRYDFVKKDIMNFYPKLKVGGIICGHDCEGKEYDERYINEDYVGSKHHGVIKAVSEIFPEAIITTNIWWIEK